MIKTLYYVGAVVDTAVVAVVVIVCDNLSADWDNYDPGTLYFAAVIYSHSGYVYADYQVMLRTALI